MGDNEEALRNERISQWQIEQVRQRNKEKKYIIALIIIIAIGFFLDFIEFIMQNPSIALPKNIAALLNTSRFIVNNLSNVTLSILQIQAAICPLVIAIIALLSGVISDVYYGVSVCNYYLNIKPIYFKQKRIIIGLISAIGAGVFFYLLGLYNVVFSLFWATCLAIIISIMELYSVFKGQNYIEGELESYCAHMLLNYDVSYDEQKEALSMFTKWWINQHDYGTFYESNKRLFLSSITVILDKKPVEGLELIEELATQIVRNVTVAPVTYKDRVFSFFEDVYARIFSYTMMRDCHIKKSFGLYDNCLYVLLDELYNVPFRNLYKACNWRSLAYDISRVAIYCHDEKIRDEESLEDIHKRFIWFISEYVKVLSFHASKGEVLKRNVWGLKENFVLLSDAGIPDDCKDKYKLVVCDYKFAYYAALIKSMQGELAASFTEIFDYKPIYYGVDYADLLYVSLMMCYVYYLSERESEYFISRDKKEIAKDLLNKFKEKKVFDNYLYALSEYNGVIDDLYKDIYRVMDIYEEVPSTGLTKTCIMHNVVKDFFLSIAVIYSGLYSDDRLLKCYANNNRSEALFKVYAGIRSDEVKEKIRAIVCCFCVKSEEIDSVISQGYENLIIISSIAYKNYLLEESKKDYGIFIDLNKNNCIIDKIKSYLEERFENISSDWTVEPGERFSEEKIVLLNQRLPVSIIAEDFIARNIKEFESVFLRAIIERLLKLRKVDKYINDDDESFDRFLICSDTKYAVGPQITFTPFEYNKRMQRNQVFIDKGVNRINIGIGRIGMLIRKPLALCIQSIEVKTRHVKLSECEYKVVDDRYLYKGDDEVELEFTKDELESYIYNEELVLMITMRVRYEVEDDKNGYIIEKPFID